MNNLGKMLLRSRRLSFLSLLNSTLSPSSSIRTAHNSLTITPETRSTQVLFRNATKASSLNNVRNFGCHGSVHLVLTPEGKPKFAVTETDPPKKYKWLTKKRLQMQRKRAKYIRRRANKRDPRRLTVRNTKKFATMEEKLKDKLKRAKIKEAALLKLLKRYELPPVQGPMVKPQQLTGEERFFIKKMGQKRSNYVPIGRRGIFGGVILNMHMHWKKHETVKIIDKSKPYKLDRLKEYRNDIARLSGGLPVQTIRDNTIIFYRGKDYEQPEVMSPIATLSKKKAMEKSKYEQSLETVRHVIDIVEKELELYKRHVSLYDDPNNSILHHSSSSRAGKSKKDSSVADVRSPVLPPTEAADLACQEDTEVCNTD